MFFNSTSNQNNIISLINSIKLNNKIIFILKAFKIKNLRMTQKKLIGCYFIHDRSGLKPFKVCNYSNNTISIYSNQIDLDFFGCFNESRLSSYQKINPNFFEASDVRKSTSWVLWKRYKYEQIWISENNVPHNIKSVLKFSRDELLNGHTILIKLKRYDDETEPHYIYIESEIILIDMKQPIIGFKTFPGKFNDTPNTYALTKNSFIFFDTYSNEKIFEFRKIRSDTKNMKSKDFDPRIESNRTEGKNILDILVLYPHADKIRRVWKNIIYPNICRLYPPAKNIGCWNVKEYENYEDIMDSNDL